jgi:hypothetical protein
MSGITLIFALLLQHVRERDARGLRLIRPIARAGWRTSACAIGFAGVTAIGHARAASQESHRAQSTGPEARGQSVRAKSDLRATTDDERARAKFFDRYGAELLEPGDTAVVGPGLPAPPIPPGSPVPTYDHFIQHLACSTRLVVLGRAAERGVHLNQRETYLFTDYDVEVERWLRPEHGAPSLKLSVAGGRVIIAGAPTIAGAQAPLSPTKRYIFFVEQIPGSGSLTPTRPPLAEGDRWTSAVRDLSLIPEIANRYVQLDSLADDIERSGHGCASERVR